jgi:glycosyltransferase involved in cell wall biosynthesis
MKIGFDAKRAFHNQTGLGNYSRTLISGFFNQFPENEYVLFNTPKPLDLPYFNRNLQESGASFRQWTGSNFSRFFGWGSVAKREKLDIYHGLSNEIPFDLKKGKVKSVVTVHDLIFKRFPEGYKPIDRWIYDQKCKFLARHADLILATSQQTADDLQAFYPTSQGRVEVVYQDCDINFHYRRRPEAIARVLYKYDLVERPYILCVSKLEKRKNHKTLLEAFRKVMHEIPEDLVLVGGRGDTADEVLPQMDDMQGRLRWLGRVETDDLVNLYDGSAFTVYPSVFEGFGIPLLESMRRGKAIVSSEGSCCGEIAGSAALYADPNSADELASCLLSLSSNSEMRKKLEVSCEMETKRFNPDKLVAQVMEKYRNLL